LLLNHVPKLQRLQTRSDISLIKKWEEKKRNQKKTLLNGQQDNDYRLRGIPKASAFTTKPQQPQQGDHTVTNGLINENGCIR
jgi:hypothetical protein